MTKKSASIEERFWAKVEKSETCWNWVAFRQSAGYGTFVVGGTKKEYAHRFAWLTLVGPVPEGMILDHVCHNRGCVNPDHLRAVSAKQNMEHRISAHKNSSTGVRGVFWNKEKRKYCARVAHNRRIHHAGYFDSIADAEAAVIAKRLELFTHNDMDR